MGGNMSEPEKYTLPRVLEIVSGHAAALRAAAEGLQATEGKNPNMLAFVGDCAARASEDLWDIDSGDRDASVCAVWSQGDEGCRQYDCLFTLPALILAVRAATAEPDAPIRAGKPWAFCQYQAEQISRDLMAWVTAHEEKDPLEYPIEVDAAEIFNLAKATIEDMGEQPFPEGFEDLGLSGSLGHLWLICHDELGEHSGKGIWHLPKYAELPETETPFAMLSADHSTLTGISREKVAPYIGGFTPPEKDAAPVTDTEEPSDGDGPRSQPEEPHEIVESESKQLMPMEAFEAMADALRPIVNGLEVMENMSGIRDLYIDRSEHPTWRFTEAGQIHLDELVEAALAGLRGLARFDYHLLTYLPRWCESQLNDTRTLIERTAWILWAASVAAGDWDVPHDTPEVTPNAAGHVYRMTRGPYQELCAKYDDYEVADKVATDKQYEDMGYIRQPNGEWHPTPEMLKEMEASHG